mmetsp:Transcript_35515/g.39908  ORF Transcript_35515/g.39908 Transcript_35515/m.39908 type:complete len:98 (+) Transcript_35515:133-426(+)
MGLPVRQWNSWLPGHDAGARVVTHSNKDVIAIRDTAPVVVCGCRPTGPHNAICRCHDALLGCSRVHGAHNNKEAVAIGDAVPVVVGGGLLAGPVDAV